MTKREIESLQKRASKLKPKPQMLPSGTWRCQSMKDGRRLSACGDTPEEAWSALMDLKLNPESFRTGAGQRGTLGDAFDRYIESKSAVLSPSTIKGYRKIRRNYFTDLMPYSLARLDQELIQRSVNEMSKTISPKSVRNAHGLLTAVLAVYRPDLKLHTTLPQKEHTEISIPTSEEVAVMLQAAAGTRMELPLYLAIWMGLRTSEIRGLTWDCIEGNQLHVKQALVEGDNGAELKGTKTYSGDRRISIPAPVKQLLHQLEQKPHQPDDFILHTCCNTLYNGLQKICRDNGLPHYRFHDLRHYHASVMLALGVPDKYAMERMGHATNNMLKTVYQHTMQDKSAGVSDAVDGYFSALIA